MGIPEIEFKNPRAYSWGELLEKAILESDDSLFIQLIRDKPLYPKNHADHDIESFGQKVMANGEGNNNKWVAEFEFGYVLAYMHPSINPKRRRGWFEVCFPYVDAWGNPAEATVGMYPEELVEL